MQGQDFQFEKLHISEAAGLSFHGFDFVVYPLQGAGGDGKVEVSQDAGSMGGKCFCKFDYWLDL
jgi:hypothetical protein